MNDGEFLERVTDVRMTIEGGRSPVSSPSASHASVGSSSTVYYDSPSVSDGSLREESLVHIDRSLQAMLSKIHDLSDFLEDERFAGSITLHL